MYNKVLYHLNKSQYVALTYHEIMYSGIPNGIIRKLCLFLLLHSTTHPSIPLTYYIYCISYFYIYHTIQWFKFMVITLHFWISNNILSCISNFYLYSISLLYDYRWLWWWTLILNITYWNFSNISSHKVRNDKNYRIEIKVSRDVLNV